MNTIKTLRVRLGVTQDVMAAGIGVSQGNVSNYERGQRMPPDVAKRLIAFSATLGHSITYDDVYGPPPVPKRRSTDRDSAGIAAVAADPSP